MRISVLASRVKIFLCCIYLHWKNVSAPLSSSGFRRRVFVLESLLILHTSFCVQTNLIIRQKLQRLVSFHIIVPSFFHPKTKSEKLKTKNFLSPLDRFSSGASMAVHSSQLGVKKLTLLKKIDFSNTSNKYTMFTKKIQTKRKFSIKSHFPVEIWEILRIEKQVGEGYFGVISDLKNGQFLK